MANTNATAISVPTVGVDVNQRDVRVGIVLAPVDERGRDLRETASIPASVKPESIELITSATTSLRRSPSSRLSRDPVEERGGEDWASSEERVTSWPRCRAAAAGAFAAVILERTVSPSPSGQGRRTSKAITPGANQKKAPAGVTASVAPANPWIARR